MKGEHPIDELFARGLRDAEITPPPAVWEGIVRERNWAHTTLLTLRRRWGFLLMALVLLGTGGAYFMAQDTSTGSAQGATVLAVKGTGSAGQPEEMAVDPGKGGDPEAPRSGEGAAPLSSHMGKGSVQEAPPSAEGSGPGANAVALNDITDKRKEAHVSELSTATSTTTTRERTHPASVSSSTNVPTRKAAGSAAESTSVNTGAQAPSATGSNTRSEHLAMELGAANESGAAPGTEGAGAAFQGSARWMRTRTSLLAVDLGSAASPTAAHAEDPYVLRNTHIFLGLQLDLTSVSGEWKGEGEEVAELNRSETWLDRKGIGMVGGMRWRSGVHMAVAASVSQLRSRFLRTTTLAGDTSQTVDTTWIATAAGPQTVYTWDIVPVTLVEPGVQERTSATNLYTLFRLAPEVGYGHRLGRCSLGLRAGPVFTATLARTGSTLVPSAEQSDNEDLPRNAPRTVALGDRSVDDRFRLSWGAFAGLDLNYHLTEGLTLGAGPVWSTIFSGTGGAMPGASLSELGGTFRVLFTLPERER